MQAHSTENFQVCYRVVRRVTARTRTDRIPEGELKDLVNHKVHRLEAGTLYTLNAHERHIVRPKTDLRMVCVFNPPVTGQETHGAAVELCPVFVVRSNPANRPSGVVQAQDTDVR